MKKSMLFYMMAVLLIFVTACSKDDDDESKNNDDQGTTGQTFTGINKVNLVTDGNTHEFVFADNPEISSESDYSAIGIREYEENTVYTEIVLGANNHFDQVSTAALIINFLGDGTGTQDISYGLGEENNLYNFTGSNFVLLTDTATMPVMYFLEDATANITNYGDVGGYIEGTFESTVVSMAGIPQPNVTINGNFKVKRFESKK